jgi:hypothetical protein
MSPGLHFVWRSDGPDYRFQFPPRNSAGTKQDGSWMSQQEHGGFDANLTGPSVEYEIYFGAQTAADVLSGCRRKFSEAVGAGCGEWDTGGADKGKRNGMRGHAQSYGGQAGGDNSGDDG